MWGHYILSIKRGKSPKYVDLSNILVFAQKCNVKKGGIDLGLAKYLDPGKFLSYPEDECMIDRDIVVNSTGNGTLGRVGIFRDDDNPRKLKVVPDSHVTVIRVCHAMSVEYIYYFLKANQLFLEKLGEGSTNQTELRPDILKMLVVPIPPLREQYRIVKKIEELLPFVDQYATVSEKLDKLNSEFPDQVKRSILQLAVEGKLVEQRPEEGTGEELFRKIQEEKAKLIKEGKIKKQKPLADIADEEKPFDIPANWKFVRFGEAITLLSGTDFKPSEYNDVGKGTVYITGASCLSDNGVIPCRWTEEPKNIAERGDVLLVCKGSGYGKTVICDIDKAHIARQIMAIKKTNLLDMKYIMVFLQANFSNIKKCGQGVIPGIDRDSILQMIFPIPPLEEQHRIVATLDMVLPTIDQLN